MNSQGDSIENLLSIDSWSQQRPSDLDFWLATEFSSSKQEEPLVAKKPEKKHKAISEADDEDDKRRRNTEASARFRAKKKAREQAIQKEAKELQEKVVKLEEKIKEQEMEIKWLRQLVNEKQQQAQNAVAPSQQQIQEQINAAVAFALQNQFLSK
ncbi:hypothetical protein HDV06_006599 [Boothiomyces sp. JEL0866]|nr:hypothetical protein HDV06_006599 [Boothiomyces sp. JEL0866]